MWWRMWQLWSNLTFVKTFPMKSDICHSKTAKVISNIFVLAYNYSKAGVMILTRTVDLHWAQMGYKIRCNAVQPGAIYTPMIQRYVQYAENPEQQLIDFAASHPMNRIG